MFNFFHITGIAVVVSAGILLAGCGGGSSTASKMPADSTMTDTPMAGGGNDDGSDETTVFGKLNSTNAGYAATAASIAANAIPNAGSITQSSNVGTDKVTRDRVSVTTEYGASRNSHTVKNGSSWQISTSDGNPRNIDGAGPFKGQELFKRTNGGILFVDVYSDIEAPSSRQGGGSDDGTQNVSLGTRIYTGNVSGSSGSVSGQPGSLNGESGTFSCTGGCRYSGGLATGGTWMFTPNRPPGAINISGVSGVAFTGTFNPAARTLGTYNGQTGYFKCLSSSCGRTTSNGRLSSLQGQWIFVPAGGTTVSTPDTDYLAGGVWLFVPDSAASADDVEIGAFGDGSDPFLDNNLQAVTGTAEYEGAATGIYAATDEVGYWDAAVTLNADFEGTDALGSIGGTVSQISADGDRLPGAMNLDKADIGSSDSGFFKGTLSGTVNDIVLSGQWGGQFFGNGHSSGQPGSVGGTAGGTGTSANGNLSFVGVFGAHNTSQ